MTEIPWGVGPWQIAEQTEDIKMQQMDLSFVWLKLSDALVSGDRKCYIHWVNVCSIETQSRRETNNMGTNLPESPEGAENPEKHITRLTLANAEEFLVHESPEDIFQMVEEKIAEMISLVYDVTGVTE